MSFRYLFALVVILSLFAIGCTTSGQADPEALRVTEREEELDRKMEAMRIAVQLFEGSVECHRGFHSRGEEFFDDFCLAAIERTYHFIIETIAQD